MWKKPAGYMLLSLSSFFLFTVVFHTAAYAQISTKAAADTPTTGFKQTLTEMRPTPMLDLTPTAIPKTTAASKKSSDKPSSATPTQTPSPTNEPTLTPTRTPLKVIPTTIPTAIPTVYTPPPAVQATGGGLNADVLFDMSNSYRAAKGLPAFQKDGPTCSLAASRAPEIAGEVASGAMHSGLHTRNLPYWNTENIISMRTETAAFNWWVNDPIHHDAIVGNHTYSCVACSGNSCAQEFTNYQPK